MNEIRYDRDLCRRTQGQLRISRDRGLTETDINRLAKKIETSGCGARREAISLRRTLRVSLLNSRSRPAARRRRSAFMVENICTDARNSVSGNPQPKPQPGHGMTHAHRLAVSDPENGAGLSPGPFRSSAVWPFEQITSYCSRSADA